MRITNIAAAIALIASPAIANGFQDLSLIDSEVSGFTGSAIGQPGGAQTQVDRQMRLAQCQQPLNLEWYGQPRSAVRVSCPGNWRIFVPVMIARQAPAEAVRPAIERRDLVRVEAGGTGFRVVRQGEAMEEGAVGESIRVKLQDGTRQGRVVLAQVLETGRVFIQIR